MANLRRLGVYGENLPTKRTKTVQQSDFLIGGLMGVSERKFNKAYTVRSPEEYATIFGGHVSATRYLPDAVKGFFDNVVGVDAKLVIASYIGNDGAGSIDAVVASREKADDGADADAYTVQPAYEEELEYGVSGNRTGTKFTQADRFTTEAAGTVAATGVSTAVLDSVIGIRVGDLICFKTNSGADLVYKIVTAKDENAKSVSWSGDFEVSGGSGETLAIGDTVTIPGFTVQTYRKSTSGVISEVDKDRGKIICSPMSAVAEFYVETIFSSSPWIKISEASASTLGDVLPADDTDPVFCTSGSDGTFGTTSGHWSDTLSLFDNEDVRFLGNPETAVVAVQSAIESYCNGREDTPIAYFNLLENQSKSQLIAIGQNYQRSDDVFALAFANWLKVEDPFSDSATAPPRNVPNVGHMIGHRIRVIGTRGIHHSEGIKQEPVLGVLGVVGDQFDNDFDRTDLAEAGINVIQDIPGIGIVARNDFTLSSNKEDGYFWSIGILMRNFFKISFVDSLQTEENLPLSFDRIRENKAAMLQFFFKMWERGSTGNVPLGETFGRIENPDNSLSTPDQHFQVVADATNNPPASLNAGQSDYDSWFTFPTPNGSMKIGVGILRL